MPAIKFTHLKLANDVYCEDPFVAPEETLTVFDQLLRQAELIKLSAANLLHLFQEVHNGRCTIGKQWLSGRWYLLAHRL